MIRSLWNPEAFEGHLYIPLESGFCLSLSLKPLDILLTTWNPLPGIGPNGNNGAFCKKKKKHQFIFPFERPTLALVCITLQVSHSADLKSSPS